MSDLDILYGIDNQQGIVRIENEGADIIEYIQTSIGTIENRICGYRPLIYSKSEKTNTHGENYYNNLDRYSIEYYRTRCRDREKYLKPKYIELAYLADTGKTLFKGMTLEQLTYCGFDIETTGLEYSRAKTNKEKLEYINPEICIPKAFDGHNRKIVKYIKNNEYISITELQNELDDGNIFINSYLKLWHELLIMQLIVDCGEKVKMASIDSLNRTEVLYEPDNEKKLLLDIIKTIKEINANLLICYNGSTLDIPFLMYRCWVNGLQFNIGRNNTEPRHIFSQLRLGVGQNEKQDDWHIFGVNYIDLYPYVIKYDSTDRRLSSYKLKDVMASYNLDYSGRLVLSNTEIQEGLKSGKGTNAFNKVYEYAKDDAKDLIKLLYFIGQADFYLTQMIPLNYDTLVFEGNVGRVNAILLRDYITKKYSMPMWKEFMDKDEVMEGTIFKYIGKTSSELGNDFLVSDKLYEIIKKNETGMMVKSITHGKEFNLDYKWLNTFKLNIEGAEVQADDTGIFEYVGDSDVSSMYPSIMINYNVFPKSDTLHTMKVIITLVRDARFKLKKDLKILKKGTIEYDIANGQQLAYKIFINAQFGALSSNGFYFKDSNACAMVTKYGREIILSLRDKLIDMGYKITALDTDGVSYTNSKPINIEYINKALDEVLPNGIGIETQVYDKIIVFARKMYYAKYPNGDYVVKGAGLTARSTPMFYRRFVKKMCYLLCNSDYDGLKALYIETIRQIQSNELPIDEFTQMKSATKTIDQYKRLLEEYPFTHDGKKKGTEEIYELAIKTGRLLKIGDKLPIYHKLTKIEKPLTETQKKKQDIKDMMNTMFEIPKTYIEVDDVMWADEYNNDLNHDYYIKLLNGKLENLLYKQYDEKKETWKGVLPQRLYNYIIQNNSLINVKEYKYIDTTSKEDDNDYFKPWKRITTDDRDELIKQGLSGQYVTIQRFCNPEIGTEDIVYQPLYFDIDNSDLNISFMDAKIIYNYFRNVLKIDQKYIMVWFSGSKGFHIEVCPELFGIKPMFNLQLVNKEIALDMIKKYKLKSLDIGSIYSTRRMWRLPFSIHPKTKRRKVWLKDFDNFNDIEDVIEYGNNINFNEEVNNYFEHIKNNFRFIMSNNILVEWIQDFYNRYLAQITMIATKKPNYKYEQLKGEYPKCITMLLKNGINTPGIRNKATLALASYFKESGVSKDMAIEEIIKFTMEIPSHLTSISGETNIRNNVKTVVNSVYNSDKYNFQCYYIYPLLKDRGFTCPHNCKLKD